MRNILLAKYCFHEQLAFTGSNRLPVNEDLYV
jgi:hypothetical protein